MMDLEETREKLADYMHTEWSSWMDCLFDCGTRHSDGTFTINKYVVYDWTRRMNLYYENLPESEKKGNIQKANEILALLEMKEADTPEICVSATIKGVGKFVKRTKEMELAVSEVRREIDRLAESIAWLNSLLPKTQITVNNTSDCLTDMDEKDARRLVLELHNMACRKD